MPFVREAAAKQAELWKGGGGRKRETGLSVWLRVTTLQSVAPAVL